MNSSFKLCTSGVARCIPETDREAFHCQVHHNLDIRVEEIADDLGISASSLSDAVNPHHDGSPLAARHHARVLALTPRNLAVTSYYAGLQNAVVVALPASDTSDDENTASAVKEFGEFLIAYATAKADRKTTPLEALTIEQQGEEAIASIVRIIENAKRDSVAGGVA